MNPSSFTSPGIAPEVLTDVPSSNPHVLSEAASLLLDIVRFSAALAVVATHLTFTELNTGFPYLHSPGEYAVPIFFVLSGFVIRFVTRSREHHLRDFLIDRASRMYSVILPAMALTLAISGICLLIDRQHFLSQWGAVSNHVLARVLLNLTFLSQSWSHNTVPLIDAPFWSLSFECLYYLAYGLLFFLRGWKRVLGILVWAALAGPQVIFLFPIWWLGCWTYDLYHHLRKSRLATLLRGITLAYLLLATVLYLIGRHTLLYAPLTFNNWFAALPNPLERLHLPILRATLLAVGTGVLAATFMLLLLLLSDMISIPRRNLWARRFRRVADGTFAIYLMHYPLLVLALFLGLLHPSTHGLTILVAAVICILLIAVSEPLDRLKRLMRDRLHRHLSPAPLHAVPAVPL